MQEISDKIDKHQHAKINASCMDCGKYASGMREACLEGESLAEVLCPTAKSGQIEQDYREDSVVATRKDKIEKLAKAHWSYVEKVIKSGADTARTFTFDEVMKMREWDYTSAAIHFYGHGFEDGQRAMAQKTLDHLKGA